MKKTLSHSAKFATLLLLVCSVAFIPASTNGGIDKRMSAKQIQDSIDYYRKNTMINYELIKNLIK